MDAGAHWIQIRSTEADVISDIGAAEPPRNVSTEEGVLSLVVDDPAAKVRRLPALYLGPELAYNHRDVTKVVDRAALWGSVIEASAEKATYTLTPCSFDGAVGLYARELFERSAFRRRLRRRGVRFDDVPFVTFEEDGAFRSDTFGSFTPRFVFLGSAGRDDPAEIVTTKGAQLPFLVVSHRLGAIRRDELRRLIDALKDVRAISTDLPEALVEELTGV